MRLRMCAILLSSSSLTYWPLATTYIQPQTTQDADGHEKTIEIAGKSLLFFSVTELGRPRPVELAVWHCHPFEQEIDNPAQQNKKLICGIEFARREAPINESASNT